MSHRFVWVDVAPFPKGDAELARHYRETVFVEPEDVIERLDLRPFIGLDVRVDGDDGARVQALYEALQRHHARRVIACCGRVIAGHGYTDFILDTQGIATWHA